MPTERPPLLGEVEPTFADRGCCVVSATDPPGRILGMKSINILVFNTASNKHQNIYTFHSIQNPKTNRYDIALILYFYHCGSVSW
jgi:hypothetical protein